MKNAEWLIKNDISLMHLYRYKCKDNPNLESIGYADVEGNYHECYRGERLDTHGESSILRWLDMDYVKPVLDDVERQYLKAVLEPFRKKILFVRKDNGPYGAYEQIIIRVKSVIPDSTTNIEFPFFKRGRMYRGMKTYKEYTMKELGL